MKKVISLFLFVAIAMAGQAQNPVQWNFSAKKIADNKYELHLVATVQAPWHIYSQTTPEGGPLPTKITFSKNPLLKTEGNTKELSKLHTKFEEVFGVDVKYFSPGKTEFVQVVTVKGKAKTNIAGSIEFMACTDEQCLPPATVNFSVALGN